MSFAIKILTFLAIGAVPFLTERIIMSFGLDMSYSTWAFVAPYVIPFMFNWILMFISDLAHMLRKCKDKSKLNWGKLVWFNIIPCIITLLFSLVLDKVPILKAPLFVLSMLGYDWLVQGAINIIGLYGVSFPVTLGLRKGLKC